MTAEQIQELRAARNKVGRIIFSAEGVPYCEGVMKARVNEREARAELELAWNSLGKLLDEVAQLAEDHARMTQTLREIDVKVIEAMQGTSRSQIAQDWWQTEGERS